MDAGSARSDCDVGAIIHDYGNPNGLNKLLRDADKVPCRNIFETHLDARRATTRGCRRPRDQTFLPIADVIRYRDQSENRLIDHRTSRFAVSCSASVVRNSWWPSESATKYLYETFA